MRTAGLCLAMMLLGLQVRAAEPMDKTPSACKQVSVALESDAETAKCMLSVDRRVLVNERCNISVSPDGRLAQIDTGQYLAVVKVLPDRRGAPTQSVFYWNSGSGRSDKLSSMGVVNSGDLPRPQLCWQNSRVEMCMSDYMRCEPTE